MSMKMCERLSPCERDAPPHPRIVEGDPLGRECFRVEASPDPPQHAVVLLVVEEPLIARCAEPAAPEAVDVDLDPSRSESARVQDRLERWPISGDELLAPEPE